MDLYSETIALCEKNDIKPSRSKGQNFLVEESVYDEIVEWANIKAADLVIEVGPGLGFLTRRLSEKASTVIAIELDDKLASMLHSNLAIEDVVNVDLVNEDVLDFLPRFLNSNDARIKKNNGRIKIVANLPYNITSIFLRKILEINKVDDLVLMLQKEVAERIVASAGEMSMLAFSVQFFAEAEILRTVPSQMFWPAPEVDSAVIRIKRRAELPTINRKKFFALAKHGFAAKRKMLKNNLANALRLEQSEVSRILQKIGLSEKVRAQELSMIKWRELFAEMEVFMS